MSRVFRRVECSGLKSGVGMRRGTESPGEGHSLSKIQNKLQRLSRSGVRLAKALKLGGWCKLSPVPNWVLIPTPTPSPHPCLRIA